MSVTVVLWVIFAHWVADFVCQTHWQASNKSKNWDALTRHVAVYTIVMAGLVGWTIDYGHPRLFSALAFGLITFVVHFITDSITSRITSRLFLDEFEKDNVTTLNRLCMRPGFSLHWFFVVIGFDQVLHYVQLFLTIRWLS
jgi:Na+/glutamate symporter